MFDLHQLSARPAGDEIHSIIAPGLEIYVHPYGPDTLHDLRSIAKSVTAIITGLAIDAGHIRDVAQPVADFFPEIAGTDKAAITIKHLLTMTSGLALDDGATWDLIQSGDPLAAILAAPLDAPPGTRFRYATANAIWLSALIQRAVGVTMLDFARPRLFAPLGIEHLVWSTDGQGHTMGGMMLYMTPRDLYKIGELYQQGGVWQGRQIVPADWVRACLTAHVSQERYGYMWGVQEDYASATGYGGQRLLLPPGRVVAFTGGLNDFSVYDRLLPQIDGTGQHIITPPAQTPPPPPVTAAHMAGRTIRLEPNVFGWETLRFDFPGRDTARVSVNGGPDNLIGLDGRYRVTEHGRFLHWFPRVGPVALRANWPEETTLHLSYRELGTPEPQEISLHFTGDQVAITAVEALNGDVERLTGALA